MPKKQTPQVRPQAPKKTRDKVIEALNRLTPVIAANDQQYQLTEPDAYYHIGPEGYRYCLTAMKIHWAATGRDTFVHDLARKQALGSANYENEVPGGCPVESFIHELIEAYRKGGPTSPELTPMAIVERAKLLQKAFDNALKHAQSWLKRYPNLVFADVLAPEQEED